MLVAIVLTLPAAAQEGVPTTPSAGPVRAAIEAPRTLFSPHGPIWIRFTLHNVSDEVVEIPLSEPAPGDGGIALPLELVFGTPDNATLMIAYEDDKPVSVVLPEPAEDADKAAATGSSLRLAPRGSVGTQLDLRNYFRGLRYAGDYLIRWQPLDGTAGTPTLPVHLEPRMDVIIVTDKPGKMTFRMLYEEAPQNVENFLELVREGFYDGKTFHRIVPEFLIQGGCPKGDGTGIRPDGKLVPAEFHDAPILPGTLCMARRPSEPDSASCQFFIALTRLPELDGLYTVIGQAEDEETLRTLQAIAEEPTDRQDRPRIPVIIRSINLVPAEEQETIRLDPQRGRTQPQSVTKIDGDPQPDNE
jgi:peptidyl-prolyl cis-trans isomerase B (cyclophilin B)